MFQHGASGAPSSLQGQPKSCNMPRSMKNPVASSPGSCEAIPPTSSTKYASQGEKFFQSDFRTCVAAKTRLQQRILAALKAAHGANRTNLAVIGRSWICWRYRYLKYPLDGHGRCGYSQQFLWSYSMVCSSLRESVLLTWVHAENSELCFTFCFYLATNSSCCMPNVVQLSISIRLEIPWNTSVSWLALEH